MAVQAMSRLRKSAPPSFALFELGFRGFYLAGAIWAIAGVALWMLQLTGSVHLPSVDAGWHIHEMIFGFVVAIIAGFGLTAVRNWTAQPTPTGLPLALLLALWIAGRVAMLSPPSFLAAVTDLAFLPAIAIALLIPILKAGQKRSLFLPGILFCLAFLNLGYHASRLELYAAPLVASLTPALYLVVLLACVIAGRVIPGFTGNAIGVKLPRGGAFDIAVIAATLLALLVSSVNAIGTVTATLALLAAAAHLARLIRWRPWASRGRPMLWILHLAYAWIPVGFVLLALAALGIVAPSAALHAFGVGALGGLIIAMTTRSARGHTVRDLAAGNAERAMYMLVPFAAAARVLAALGVDTWWLLIIGAVAWSCAFGLFLLRYAPWLLRPRLDGARG